MRGHIHMRGALVTLLLMCFLGVTPGVASPAAATPTITDEEPSSLEASEDAPDGAEPSPTPTPNVEEAPQEPSEQEATSTEVPESPESSVPEDPERGPAEDEAPQPEEEPADEEPTPLQRMQRNATAASDTATVQVRVGADRTGSGASALAGAQLALFRSLGSTTPVSQSWGVCTSNSQGTCTFTIPSVGPGGANRDAELYVKAWTAPSGYSTVSQLGTGNAGQLGSTTYGFRIGAEVRECQWQFWGTCQSYAERWQIRAGETYRSFASGGTRATFMSESALRDPSTQASGGVFAFVRNNPSLSTRCGIDVAVIQDFSSSMNGQENNLARTTTSLVDTLEGTPSTVSLYNFGTSSPATSVVGQPNRTQQQSVATRSGAETVRNWYSRYPYHPFPWGQRSANFSIPLGSEGTNWDRGLNAPAVSGKSYDAAVVITDGSPTFHGSAQGNGSQTRFIELENAIFSANALKASGTRVIAVGLGTTEIANAVSGLNLRAISASAATVQNSSFTEAGRVLADMVQKNCQNTVSVVKEVIPEGGDLGQAGPAGGWHITAESADAPVSLVGSDDSRGTTISGLTDRDNGAFTVGLDFEGQPLGATTNLTFRERPQDGFALESVQGQNARCTDSTGRSIAVNNIDNGFTLRNVGIGTGIECVLVNRELPPAASVRVDKTWIINGDEYAQGSQPDGLEAELQLSAQEESEETSREATWSGEHEGYFAGDKVRIEEVVDISKDRAGCRLASAQVTAINGKELDVPEVVLDEGYVSSDLVAGVNRFTLTNTVECEQSLTLNTKAQGGDAVPEDWALAAYSTPEDPTTGEILFTGVSGVANTDVPADQTLQLAATNGPSVYVQDDNRSDPSISPLASGSWQCAQLDEAGRKLEEAPSTGGADGTVKVPLGGTVECTATSRTAELTLLKHVINENGGTLEPGDFTLLAGAAFEGVELSSGPVTGSEERSDDTTVLVRPRASYRVTEDPVDGNLAYRTGELQRYLGSEEADHEVDHQDSRLWETVSDAELSVAADRHATYRLVSYDVAPSILPQTGGIGTVPYLFGGAMLVALAVMLAIRSRNPAQRTGRSAS